MPLIGRADLPALVLALWALGRGAAGLRAGPAGVWATWLALGVLLLLLAPGVQRVLRPRAEALRLVVPGGVALVGLTAALSGPPLAGWRLAAFPVAILLVVAAAGRPGSGEPNGWRLLALALALGLVAGVWDRALRLPLPGNLRLAYALIGAAILAVWTCGVARPLATFRTDAALTARDLGTACVGLVALLAVALPLGLLADYVVWNPEPMSPVFAVERLVALTLFVALPEELLFRGLIQEGLTRLRGPRVGLVVGALFFGLLHAPKATGLLPEQLNSLGVNWRFAALATLAGLAYGWVYQRTGRLMAVAVTHGAANWLWGSWFLR